MSARAAPVGLLAAAGVAATLVALTGGPVRAVAGAVLCLYLPGRLAVLALCGRAVDPVLGTVLTVTLSLAATMLVGLVAAATAGVDAVAVAIGLLVLCVLSAGAVWARRPPDPAAPAGDPAAPDPATPAAPAAPAGPAGPGRAAWLGLAAIPSLLLVGLLAVRITDVVRYRGPDAHYTELSVGPSATGRPSAVVHSREAAATTFRLEERVDGAVVQTTQFTLGPGQRGDIGLLHSSPGVEVILYRVDRATPYRRVIL